MSNIFIFISNGYGSAFNMMNETYGQALNVVRSYAIP